MRQRFLGKTSSAQCISFDVWSTRLMRHDIQIMLVELTHAVHSRKFCTAHFAIRYGLRQQAIMPLAFFSRSRRNWRWIIIQFFRLHRLNCTVLERCSYSMFLRNSSSRGLQFSPEHQMLTVRGRNWHSSTKLNMHHLEYYIPALARLWRKWQQLNFRLSSEHRQRYSGEG